MHLRDGDAPYVSAIDAMRYWPETATAIAARCTADSCEADATREMVAAIWLHDIVYDPKASDNEEMSAFVAEQDLAGSGISISAVLGLTLGTKRHGPGSAQQNLLNDLDLGSLGAQPPAYTRYAHQIRMEYANVPPPQYRSGRAAVLTAFDNQQIFQTERFAHLEEQAHKNLRAEIARLR